MFSWAQKRISLRYPLRGGLEISIFVFSPILPAIATKQSIKLDILATSLFILSVQPQNNALNIIYIKFIYTSYSLRLNHFLNSLIQYANFPKIHQKKRQLFANSFLYIVFLADFEEISILYFRELRKKLSRKLYEV